MKGVLGKIFSLVALVLFAFPSLCRSQVSASEYSFVVWLHDGGKVSFPLEEHPVVTYRDGLLVVSSGDAAVEYAHASVCKFTIEEVEAVPKEPTPDPTPDPEPLPESELYFVAWLHNGGRISFPFSERPRLTYSSGDIVITTDEEELWYAHADVRKFTLSDEDISRDENAGISVAEREAQWLQQGDAMVFADCTPGECVGIFDASGRLLHQYAISSDGTLQISLFSLAEGVYIVKTESITYKFMKR